ncbi:MAG: hypothetical protein IPQ19_04475 [Bacteroidetes bacterium]|nr:hypothetical protein [Bacteroidota bacterium]
MYKLTITLKQHTPIIHFQHDQAGATLRASEVKPKLDKFIIEQMGGIDKIPKEWHISDNNEALDYKMTIVSDSVKTNIEKNHTNSPMYFGNQKGTEEKHYESRKYKHYNYNFL